MQSCPTFSLCRIDPRAKIRQALVSFCKMDFSPLKKAKSVINTNRVTSECQPQLLPQFILFVSGWVERIHRVIYGHVHLIHVKQMESFKR